MIINNITICTRCCFQPGEQTARIFSTKKRTFCLILLILAADKEQKIADIIFQ